MYRGFLLFLCIILGSLQYGHSVENKNVTTLAKNQTNTVAERIWVSQLFDLARQQFDITTNKNAACKRDYEMYKLHARNQSIWAIRMLESTEWPEIGIFAGHTHHMGNWPECVSINSYGIMGQYCLPTATFDYIPDKVNFTIEEVPDEASSAWVAMKMYLKQEIRVNRHEQTWAMCIPASCNSIDLLVSLKDTVEPVFKKHNFNVSLEVDPTFCSTREVPIPRKVTPIVKAFFVSLILIILGANIFDFIERKFKDVENDENEPAMKEFISAFSIRKNFMKLVESKPSDHPPIHFCKVIAMCFIIFGHLFVYTLGFPMFNTEYIENEFRKWNIVLTRTSIVDLFFAMSGFLTCYYSLESTKKGGIIFLIASVIVRYLRMVPVFGVLMMFIVYFLPHTGNGPFWKERIFREVEHCSSSWWTNMLAVNNFVQPEKQCLLVSWYIAVDIQLSILGCILLYAIVKNRKVGYIMCALVFLIGNVASFLSVYINRYYGLTRLYISFQKEPRRFDEFNYFYIHPHPRIAPYIFGFAIALTATELKERGYKFKRMSSRLILLILVLISEGSQWYGMLFYKFGRKYDIIENSLYGAMNRWLFLLPYGYICVQYLSSGLEPFLDTILNQKIYVPFGRLTYSVFLVNSVVELYFASRQADLMPSSTSTNMYVFTASSVLYSYLVGLAFHIFLEAPIVNLTKLLQRLLLEQFVPLPKKEEIATELPEKKAIES